MFQLRQKDYVKVMVGRSKGQEGDIMRILGDYIFVRGVNLLHYTVRRNPQADEQGGIRQKEGRIHVSNVVLWDPQAKKRIKAVMNVIDGKRVRCNRETGKPLNVVSGKKIETKKQKAES